MYSFDFLLLNIDFKFIPLLAKRHVTSFPSAVIRALVQLSQNGLDIEEIKPISPLPSSKLNLLEVSDG